VIRLVQALALCCSGSMLQADPCTLFIELSDTQKPPVLAHKTATCAQSKLLGGDISRDCHWVFAYRSDAARHAFRSLAQDLAMCAEEGLDARGKSVNHPDSFDQHTAVVFGQRVSVSLKDKGALQKTMVFARSTQAR
jgi:hypothetical protein